MTKIHLIEDYSWRDIENAIVERFWGKYDVLLYEFGQKFQNILRDPSSINPDDIIIVDGCFPLFWEGVREPKRLGHILAMDMRTIYTFSNPLVIHTADPYLFEDEKSDLEAVDVDIIQKNRNYSNLIDWILSQEQKITY